MTLALSRSARQSLPLCLSPSSRRSPPPLMLLPRSFSVSRLSKCGTQSASRIEGQLIRCVLSDDFTVRVAVSLSRAFSCRLRSSSSSAPHVVKRFQRQKEGERQPLNCYSRHQLSHFASLFPTVVPVVSLFPGVRVRETGRATGVCVCRRS